MKNLTTPSPDNSRPIRIALLGQTGSGKSSLVNALAGQTVTAVSDVRPGTQLAVEARATGPTGEKWSLIDLPGLGQSRAADLAHLAHIRTSLPEADLVLWLVRADARTLSVDAEALHALQAEDLIPPARLLVVISQADRIEPCRQWDVVRALPSPLQSEHLDARKAQVSAALGVASAHIICVAATEGWALDTLRQTMTQSLASAPLKTSGTGNKASSVRLRLESKRCEALTRLLADNGHSLLASRIQATHDSPTGALRTQDVQALIAALEDCGARMAQTQEALKASLKQRRRELAQSFDAVKAIAQELQETFNATMSLRGKARSSAQLAFPAQMNAALQPAFDALADRWDVPRFSLDWSHFELASFLSCTPGQPNFAIAMHLGQGLNDLLLPPALLAIDEQIWDLREARIAALAERQALQELLDKPVPTLAVARH